MMAVPAKKVTRRRRGNRNSHLVSNLEKGQMENCGRCGAIRLRYNVCSRCFFTYKGEDFQFYFRRKKKKK